MLDWVPAWLPMTLGWYALASLAAAGALRRDKRAAERDAWRVRESTLHTLELLGGWPGSWLARRRLRHKTRKLAYRAVFWLIVAAHVGAWITLGWLSVRA